MEFEPDKYQEVDNSIRRTFRRNHIHLKAGNKDRLYLDRSELGRDLHNVNHKCEKILITMYNFLNERQYLCSRKDAILAGERERAKNLGTINGFLRSKYGFEDDEIIKMKVPIEKQKK